MPYFYEEAAALLYILTAKGLVIHTGVDARTVVLRLAAYFAAIRKYAASHADIASAVLAELEDDRLAVCHPARRPKVVALLGTAFGNFLTMRNAAKR